MRTFYYKKSDEILKVPCDLDEDGDGGQSLIVGDQRVLTLMPNGQVCRHPIECRDGLHIETDGRVKICNA